MSKHNAQPVPSTPPSKPAGQQPAKGSAWHDSYTLQLDRQLTLLSSLETLSHNQRSLIALEDPEPLLHLMQERQTIVDELVDIDAKTHDSRAQVLGDGATALDRAVREGLRFKLEQVAARAKGVMHRDAKDQELLQTRRKKLSEELSELAGGKRAVAAYGQSAAGGGGGTKGPVFQDQEG